MKNYIGRERLWEIQAYLPQHILEFVNKGKGDIVLFEMFCQNPESVADPRAKIWTSLSKKELQEIAKKMTCENGSPISATLQMIATYNCKTQRTSYRQIKVRKKLP